MTSTACRGDHGIPDRCIPRSRGLTGLSDVGCGGRFVPRGRKTAGVPEQQILGLTPRPLGERGSAEPAWPEGSLGHPGHPDRRGGCRGGTLVPGALGRLDKEGQAAGALTEAGDQQAPPGASPRPRAVPAAPATRGGARRGPGQDAPPGGGALRQPQSARQSAPTAGLSSQANSGRLNLTP